MALTRFIPRAASTIWIAKRFARPGATRYPPWSTATRPTCSKHSAPAPRSSSMKWTTRRTWRTAPSKQEIIWQGFPRAGKAVRRKLQRRVQTCRGRYARCHRAQSVEDRIPGVALRSRCPRRRRRSSAWSSPAKAPNTGSSWPDRRPQGAGALPEACKSGGGESGPVQRGGCVPAAQQMEHGQRDHAPDPEEQ